MVQEIRNNFRKTLNKSPNMQKDLQEGGLGELKILKYLTSSFKRTESNQNDLINISTGVKVEVKSESYSHERVAIEQYSNKELKTIGGAHKAKRDGCKYIVHIFKKTNVAIIFNVDQLLEELGEPSSFELKFENLYNCKPFQKYNQFDANGKKVKKPWITKGYAVPLSWFSKDIYKIINLQEGVKIDSLLL